ncbi:MULTISPECIES: hypothetical protein [Halolamina]|uniref:Uncharacterized protein n=1 Tax=Halolamina pelagica TaxID=699431 RepID=A0A1I5MDJ4_9EURY|nr:MULTISPECIES: hypothetical protein [Halolamina]NHX35957.1 hypothetical protein [Halolamina sp. R1-12]SFP07016.1 hypothetical protein SAMN05216277_101198 [Halolamina pelagica]
MSIDPDDGVDAEAGSGTELETSGDTDISTANTMRERADESRLKLYVILSANRLVVTAALGLLLFATFVAIGSVGGFYENLNTGDTKATIFSTMLGAIITGTTLIVTISQLVISQENGPLGDQHARMSNTMDFRNYMSDMVEEPVPVDPSAFLQELVNETKERAETLRGSVSGSDDNDLRAEVDEFTDSVTGNADAVQEELDGARFGSFDVLYGALNFNYSWKIFQVERIADEYADEIDEDTETVLSEFKTALSMWGPAREHIKTLYFQWALIDLSQLILYVSVPALLVAGAMLGFFGTAPIPGVTLGVQNVVWVVGAGFTVTSLPFLLLVSYISRIATVAKRTLAIGPLILRGSQR